MKRLAAFLLAFFFFVGAGSAAAPDVAYIHFDSEINAKSAEGAVKAIRTADERHAQVVVFDFTTSGGVIPEGYRIIKAMETSPAMFICVVDGRAESMGFAILQSCDVRVMTRRSFLMAHQPHTQGEFVVRVVEAKNLLDEMKVVSSSFAIQCSRRLHMTQAEYDAKVADGREWYLGWEEALKIGAVDDVADSVREVVATAHRMKPAPKP